MSDDFYARSMNVYRPRQRPSKQTKLPRRRGRGLASVLILLTLVALGDVILPNSSVAHQFGKVLGAVDFPAKHRAAELAAAKAAATKATITFAGQVNAIIAANPQISFSVSTVTADSGAQHYGVSIPFLASSTTKLLTAADYLHRVENHKATLSQQIDGVPAEQLLEAMVVNSDDTAWEDLNQELTYPVLENYAHSTGLTSYSWGDNSVTSDDLAHLLSQLYQGTLLNSAHRSLLLGWMQRANYRDFVVPAVPADDTVYHKIGLYLDNVHDATIITHDDSWLVLVICTDGHGFQNWPNRAAIMQQIARDAIADYLPGS